MLEPDVIALIRECSKDEESYNRLLALFYRLQNPASDPATPAPAIPAEAVIEPGSPHVQALLQAALSQLPDGALAIVNRELRFVYANGEGLRQTGIDPAMVIGMSPADLFPSGFADQRVEDYRRTLAGEAVESFHQFNGRIYLTRHRPLRNADGEVIAAMMLSQEMTYYRQLENELREKEAYYRQVFDDSALVKLLISTDCERIIDVNHAGVAYYGYTREELLSGGLALIAPYSEEDRQRWIDDVTDGSLVSVRSRHRLADGTMRDVDTYINRVDMRTSRLLYTTVIDVTESVQAQHALKESQRLIQLVTETLPDIVFVYDVSLQANIYVNRQLSLSLGYSHNPHIDIYSLPVYLFAEDRPLVTQSLQNVLNSLPDDDGNVTRHSIEIRVLHHDSSVRWFSLQSSVFRRTPEGEVSQVIGILQDITHRKQAEQALESARWFIERVTSAIPDIVFVFNYDYWQYVYFNRNLANTLGYQISDHASPDNDFLAFMHTDDRVLFQQYNLRLWSADDDQVYEFECRLQHHDGQWRFYHLRQMVSRRDDEGNTIETLGIAQDITHRKQTENALSTSEARYRTLVQNLPNTVVILYDHDLRYLLVEGNETLGVTGFSKETIEGRRMPEVLPQSSVDMLLPHYLTALKGEEVQFIHEVNGAHFQTHFLPVFLPSGEVDAAIIVSRDVTRQRQAEEQALAYVAQQERLRLLSDFITMASHQFGTPLAIINSSADLIRRIDDPERRAAYSHRIEEQVENIRRLVHKFMTMSRLDISDDQRNDYFVLNDAVQNVVYSLPRAFQSRISYTPPPEGVLMTFQGDQFQIQDALKEIIENALLYSSDTVRVTLTLTENSEGLIEVIDRGVGIQPAELPRIFERFYRVDSAQTMIGFGLGLSIAQTIVNRHAGRIEARSTPDSGSTFRLVLPLVEG